MAGQAQIPVPPLSRNARPGHQPFGQVFSCSKGKYLQIHKPKQIYPTAQLCLGAARVARLHGNEPPLPPLLPHKDGVGPLHTPIGV